MLPQRREGGEGYADSDSSSAASSPQGYQRGRGRRIRNGKVRSMNCATDPDLTALQVVSGELASLVGSVADGQWSLATPCPGWDLVALVDHVVGGDWFTVRVLSGQSAEEALALTISQFAGGNANSDQAVSSLADQLGAFSQPGVLDERWSHVVGELSGRQILRLRLHDLIVHLSDMQRTLGSGAGPPEVLITWGERELANDSSLAAQHFELDDAETAYLRRFGRRWPI
jgi:uncharacterized protein (TIGR03086 family)